MTSPLMNNYLNFASGIAHQQYLPAEEGILRAYNDGCTHWYVDGSLHGEMVPDWSDERIENLNSLIKKYNVQPIFHGNFKAPLGSDVDYLREAAVVYVKKEIDIAAKIGAPLVIHGGGIVEPKKIVLAKQKALDNYILSVKELAEYAAAKSVDIYLENLSNYKNYRPFHYVFTHMEEYDYVFNKIDHKNVYFFLDAGHANVGEGDPVAVVDKYHDKIKGISFSNNNGEQDQHFSIGRGTVNYSDFIETINRHNWKGLVAFEVRDKTTLDSVKELASA
ncbi:sugar phosphate isomerase/epimerase family protein [Acinetobacter oleivorans]|uniref:sugar phosphate isomerase/epimerase family protein n=1 Tax=Acinetobacter oleivorans TaxID=1148157 RepID=UPI001CD1ED4A|nr:sugar phosphate isomerase/epimerase [Acinetobacter oleivorans]